MEESSEPAMPANRTSALEMILSQNPADSLARYGLAMERIKAGEFEEAVREFTVLLEAKPDYLYAYFHAGQTLEKLSRSADARRMYTLGIEAAVRKGDSHAQSELQTALDLLG